MEVLSMSENIGRSSDSIISTRLLLSISHPSERHRTQISQHIQVFLPIFAKFSQPLMMLRNVDMVREDSHSIPNDDDVSSVKAQE